MKTAFLCELITLTAATTAITHATLEPVENLGWHFVGLSTGMAFGDAGICGMRGGLLGI